MPQFFFSRYRSQTHAGWLASATGILFLACGSSFALGGSATYADSVPTSTAVPTSIQAPTSTESRSYPKLVHVGLLAPRGDALALQKWQPTFDGLSQRIGDVSFQLHPLTLNNMAQAVQQRHMDFILTNPGQAVQLGRRFELSWLATQTKAGVGSHGIGSALVVRQDSPFYRFEDLYHKPIAAVSKQAFGGYLTLQYHLLEQGLSPDRFFSNVHFLGFPVDVNLYQLRDGIVDAAIVPVCLLETMTDSGLLPKEAFRVITNPERAPDDPSHRCQTTTQLYPNWSIARTAHGSPEIAKMIARELLALPTARVNGTSGWTTPVSLLAVDHLYETLDLHPLVKPFWKQALRWLNAHKDSAFLVLALILLIAGYHFWLQMSFRRSQETLHKTLTDLADKQAQLEHAQRIAILDELGSTLAHELNQPLSAIRNFTESIQIRLRKNLPEEKITPVVQQIVAQLDRTDAIIGRLRQLIKQPKGESQQCLPGQLLDASFSLMDHRLKEQNIRLITHPESAQTPINADPVALEQVLVNLIGNAIDACCEYRDQHAEGQATSHTGQQGTGYQPEIEITQTCADNELLITIRDNGTGLLTDGYPKAFLTTKTEGLGLGWVISRDIAERHGGTLRIENISPHGCLVSLKLPLAETQKTLG